MQLVCLGTTGFHPNQRRHTACFLLPEVGVVLDAGTGLFRLADYFPAPDLADGPLNIFLSHVHLDHVVGLTYLVEVYGIEGQSRVTVHAAEDKLTAIQQHVFATELFPVPPGYQFRPLGETSPLPANIAGDLGQLRTFPLKHPGGSLGMRLDWPGHSMAYVTDTTADPEAAYVEQLHGVDLLLHEANFPPGYQQQAELTGHSCLDQTAKVAAAAGVQRLVVVHVDTLLTKERDFDLTAARAIFPQIEIACDLQTFDF